MSTIQSTSSGPQESRVAWAASVLVHGLVVAFLISQAGKVLEQKKDPFMRVEVRKVVPKPVEVKPPEPAVPEKPKPKPPPPPEKTIDLTQQPQVKVDTAPAAKPAKPIFGLNKKAVKLGGAFKVRVGNTLQAKPGDKIIPVDQVPDGVPVASSQVTKMSSVLTAGRPRYPEEMRQLGLEGTVQVEVIIGKDGTARSATVVDTIDKRFNAAAKEAAMGTRFSPAEANGVPVTVKIRIPVEFSLSDQ